MPFPATHPQRQNKTDRPVHCHTPPLQVTSLMQTTILISPKQTKYHSEKSVLFSKIHSHSKELINSFTDKTPLTNHAVISIR